MGTRDKAADIDFSDFLEEEAESQLKEAGEPGLRPLLAGWRGRLRCVAGGQPAPARVVSAMGC